MRQPPIVVRDEHCASADRIFRPVDAAAVPEIAAVLARLQVQAPEILAAVEDVDRSLIWAAMQRSPLQHLDECAHTMEALTSLRERSSGLAPRNPSE